MEAVGFRASVAWNVNGFDLGSKTWSVREFQGMSNGACILGCRMGLEIRDLGKFTRSSGDLAIWDVPSFPSNRKMTTPSAPLLAHKTVNPKLPVPNLKPCTRNRTPKTVIKLLHLSKALIPFPAPSSLNPTP